jgi:hypothetical protein
MTLADPSQHRDDIAPLPNKNRTDKTTGEA